jgi:hypothetical protein
VPGGSTRRHDDWLFDAGHEYLEQLAAYKRHKGNGE